MMVRRSVSSPSKSHLTVRFSVVPRTGCSTCIWSSRLRLCANRLQMLEKLSLELVDGSLVLSFQPRFVGRNVVHGAELIAHKGVAHDRNALLRMISGGWMDFLKFRSQKMKAAQPSLRSLDSTFLTERWRWRRKHHFPGRWGRECVVVLREKTVQ